MKQILKLKPLKHDKGTAGLTILLSLIVMLFVIGLIVMIFSLMSASLSTSTYTVTTTSAVNESIAKPTTAGITLAGASQRNGACGTITAMYNGTAGESIGSSNYTQTGCVVKNNTNAYGSTWFVSYPYTYSADNQATSTINQTGGAIAGVTAYFPLFITIGAMVVLILLTVIIITAIRSSGLVSGDTSGQNRVGSA